MKTYSLALESCAGGITCGWRFDATDDDAAIRFARQRAQAQFSRIFGLSEILPGHIPEWGYYRTRVLI